MGELRDTLADVKAMMTREYKTKDIFTSGVGTAIAAEMIEACKYARNPDPYAGTNYHGHFTDARCVPWACLWSPAISPASWS